MKNQKLIFGVMSGTSLDGIDVVLIKVTNNQIELIEFAHKPYPNTLANALLFSQKPSHNDLEVSVELGLLHAKITASIINNMLGKLSIDAKDVCCIGYHGQTIRHQPMKKFSIQIGNAHLLAEKTNIAVVADFRNRDIVAGGQGAPLVPAFHQRFFSSSTKNRIIINIGGISNLTYLRINHQLIGFDCGPGNLLLDHWVQKNKNKSYDNQGKWARTGKIIPKLLTNFLKEPFFQRKLPKSTGRDLFNSTWLENFDHKNENPEDVQRTLLELTALSISMAINKYCNGVDEIFICGGGSKNLFLKNRLEQITSQKVNDTEKLGIPSQSVEAVAFGWLANESISNTPNNSPEITGSLGKRILGVKHPA
jgi:anhydro-N-acetylmuramic acid kinase